MLWVGSQILWLQQGFQLEFLGKSTFVPGLWGSGLLFYAVNMWLLGIIAADVGGRRGIWNEKLIKVAKFSSS